MTVSPTARHGTSAPARLENTPAGFDAAPSDWPSPPTVPAASGKGPGESPEWAGARATSNRSPTTPPRFSLFLCTAHRAVPLPALPAACRPWFSIREPCVEASRRLAAVLGLVEFDQVGGEGGGETLWPDMQYWRELVGPDGEGEVAASELLRRAADGRSVEF